MLPSGWQAISQQAPKFANACAKFMCVNSFKHALASSPQNMFHIALHDNFICYFKESEVYVYEENFIIVLCIQILCFVAM